MNMNLSYKLFDVIDEEPVITPIIINLGPFKDLYKLDKTEDKSKYAQQLLFIWYLCDPTSPLFNSDNREEESMTYAFGKKIKITKALEKCIEEYKRRQSTPETRALEKTINICDNMVNGLVKSEDGVKEYYRLIDDINKELKREKDVDIRIDLLGKRMELEKKLADEAKVLSDLIPKIGKQLDSIMEMRKKVQKSVIELDSESNKDAISNFVVDEFIDKYSR